jgi:ribose transport system substrate-binding protein
MMTTTASSSRLPVRSLALSLVACLGLIAGGCEDRKEAAAPTSAAPAAKRIAVVPKGTTHEFWKSVQAGAMQAQDESKGAVAVTYRGPEKEDDREQQVALMQNLISAKYDAIVLAPLDSRILVEPVKQAVAAHIPVVIMDSGLEGEAGKDYVTFVATDSEAGGRLAGEKMASLLPKGGKVLLLRYMEGSASTTLREKGFVDAIGKAAGVTLVDPHRYAGATRATAQEAAENLLAANGDIAGVFCPNESSTFGMMLAMRSRGMLGKIAFIGFDSSAELAESLKNGEINALVLQNPIKMGHLAVQAAADALAGRTVAPRIDTGVAIVTRESMTTPEHAALLFPGKK